MEKGVILICPITKEKDTGVEPTKDHHKPYSKSEFQTINSVIIFGISKSDVQALAPPLSLPCLRRQKLMDQCRAVWSRERRMNVVAISVL